MLKKKWINAIVKLSVKGELLEVEMSFPAKPVKPHRVLPVLQKMTNGFVDIGVKEAESAGKSVSCAKGCGACCRQPVPISEIEVYQIAALVENMPEPRRRVIRQRFAEACRHFHEIGWFEKVENSRDLSSENVRNFGMEYFHENVPCPFLEDESCSIHSERPLSCREYLVTSPAINCSAPTPEIVETVEIPYKLSSAILNVGRTNNMQKTSFVPLVRALEWAKIFPEKFQRKMGTEWMNDVIHSMKNKKSQPN